MTMRPSYAVVLAKHQENLANASPTHPYIFQTHYGIHNYVGVYNGQSDWAYITRDGSEIAPHRIYNLPCIKTIPDADLNWLPCDKNGNRRGEIYLTDCHLGFMLHDEICEVMKSMGWKLRGGYFRGQLSSSDFFITEYINRAKYGV